MTLPLFDGDAIGLRVNPDSFISGGLLAGLDGSLLTWSVTSANGGRFLVYGASSTREIDTATADLSAAATLNLNIRNKPTYTLDFDQLSNGNVMVSWIEPHSPGSDSYFRIYDAAGRAVTPKTAFAPLGNDAWNSVNVTALEGGGFCGIFGEFRQGSGESFFQVYSDDGTATTGPIRMNPARAGDQDPIGMTDLGDGQFQVMWHDRQDTGAQSLMVRVFDTLGAAQNRAFVVTGIQAETYVTNVHSTVLANGDVVVTWRVRSFGDAAPETVHGRILHGDGRPAGAEFTIATASGLAGGEFSLESSALVALDDGRWMMAWTDQRFDSATFERSSQLYGRIYNADGSVNEDTFDLDLRPDYIAAVQMEVLADGRVAVRYETGYVNEASGAYVQIIDPRLAAIALTGTDVGDQFKGTVFDDTIRGGNGGDKIDGGSGNDLIFGDAQGDTLLGGAGNDLLTGARGDDVLTGNLGRDTFVFATGAGSDRVTDFNGAQDKLNLHGFHFADAAAALLHFAQGVDGAEFTLGADRFVLVGVDAATLTAGMFVL